jgi:hypothetical protein
LKMGAGLRAEIVQNPCKIRAKSVFRGPEKGPSVSQTAVSFIACGRRIVDDLVTDEDSRRPGH